MLYSFYPFGNEEELKSPPVTGSYRAKLLEPGVIDIINRNKPTIEPFSELVDQALLSVHSDIQSHDAFSQQENDDVYEQMSSTVDSFLDNSEDPTESAAVLDEAVYAPVYSGPSLMPDSELNSNVPKRNQKQRQLFDIVHSWAKNVLKSRSLNPNTSEKIKPLHVFLTGNAGCGKSFLMKVIYQSLTKTLSYGDVVIEKPKVLVMAPTGDAAIQVDGTTVHTALGIPEGNFEIKLPPLHDKMKCSLRTHLSDLKVIIIDKIFMVLNELLFYLHLPLNEIFSSVNNDPFAGLTVVVVGDLLQLPLVGGHPVYASYKNNWQNFDLLWRHFKVFELTNVMRQRRDDTLIDLLNNVQIARSQASDLTLLQSKNFTTAGRDFYHETLHTFAENAFANVQNQKYVGSNK